MCSAVVADNSSWQPDPQIVQELLIDNQSILSVQNGNKTKLKSVGTVLLQKQQHKQ